MLANTYTDVQSSPIPAAEAADFLLKKIELKPDFESRSSFLPATNFTETPSFLMTF